MVCPINCEVQGIQKRKWNQGCLIHRRKVKEPKPQRHIQDGMMVVNSHAEKGLDLKREILGLNLSGVRHVVPSCLGTLNSVKQKTNGWWCHDVWWLISNIWWEFIINKTPSRHFIIYYIPVSTYQFPLYLNDKMKYLRSFLHEKAKYFQQVH